MIQISYMLKKSSGKFLFFKNSHIFNLITDATSTELQFLRGLLRNKNIRYLIFINSNFQKQEFYQNIGKRYQNKIVQ